MTSHLFVLLNNANHWQILFWQSKARQPVKLPPISPSLLHIRSLRMMRQTDWYVFKKKILFPHCVFTLVDTVVHFSTEIVCGEGREGEGVADTEAGHPVSLRN